MGNEKKEDRTEEIPLGQYFDENRGPFLYGKNGGNFPVDKVKKYKCPNCTNTFMADEICWNDGEDGEQIPFCPNCSNNCKNYDKAYVLDKV